MPGVPPNICRLGKKVPSSTAHNTGATDMHALIIKDFAAWYKKPHIPPPGGLIQAAEKTRWSSSPLA